MLRRLVEPKLHLLAVWVFLTGWMVHPVACQDRELDSSVADYRQPVDAELSPDESQLAVACKKTGCIMVVDLNDHQVQQQIALGGSVDELIRLDGEYLAALGMQDHRLHLLRWDDRQLKVLRTIETSNAPVRAEWSSQNQLLRVACLWSHRIETYQFHKESEGALSSDFTKVTQWDLSIAPRHFKTISNQELVVIADAFGNRLQLLDGKTGKLLKEHAFVGHGICGIECLDGRQVGLAYADLSDFAKTDENDIHWGMLLANDVRWLSIDSLLHGDGEEIYRESRVQPVGIPGNGAAEPTLFRSSPTKKLVVACGGTDQVAIGSMDGYRFRYVNVGRYPSALAFSHERDWAFVVNQFEDSISMVDLAKAKLVDTIWLGPVRKLTDVELGEKLFHDASLSHDRWMTCGSCHVDGHTSGALADNLGDRSYGAAKRIPTLLGIARTEPYSWQGHDATMHQQITRSVLKTMQSYRILDSDEIEHVIGYCESLTAPPSLKHARSEFNQERWDDGRRIFESHGCHECHIAPNYTSPDVYDVGFRDEKGASLEWHCRVASDFRCSVYVVPDEVGFEISS